MFGANSRLGAARRLSAMAGTRPLVAMLVLGAFAQVGQAVLVRESLVVFYGNEASLSAFYGSWLLWVALGSVAAVRWWPARAPDAAPGAASAAMRKVLLALPLMLTLQVLALRTVRVFLDVSAGQLVPLGQLLSVMALVTLPTGVLVGLAFPLVCQAIDESAPQGPDQAAVGPVAWSYVADALGALLGGILFTFVLIRWLGLVQTLGIATFVLATAAAALPLAPGPTGTQRRSVLAPWGLALLGLGLATPPVAVRLDAGLEALRFATLQRGMRLLDAGDTPYGHVAVAKLGELTSVVADGQIQQSFPLPGDTEMRAAYFYAQAPEARRVLILGGYAGGLAGGLLRYPVDRIDQVEQDRAAFERVRPFLAAPDREALSDPRLRMRFGDGRQMLRQAETLDDYDLILSLDASPSTAAGNRLFTRQAFERARARLTDGGVFCTQVGAASNYLGRVVEGYAGSVYRTLRSVFQYVSLVPGDVQIFCASDAPGRLSEDASELTRRYRATRLADHSLPPGAFDTLLPPGDVAFVRGQLDQALAQGKLPLNTDAQPVTYYLNMLLWGKQSASGFVDWLERLQGRGPWPYLIPPLLLVGLGLMRRSLGGLAVGAIDRGAGVFALGTLGAVAMAGELCLLFSFQAHAGVIFERIALLGGFFMTGLALGGGLSRRLATAGPSIPMLAATLGVMSLSLLALPLGIEQLARLSMGPQQTGYLMLSFALGLVSGAGFTLSLGTIARPATMAGSGRSALASGGVAMAADSFGGAVGGLVGGSLMVPILGIDGTCRVLAALLSIALVPLGLAWLEGRHGRAIAGTSERARASFPWSGLGWGLLYAVLLVYAWHLMELGSAPGPQLRLDPDRLAEVAGPARFESRDQPFIHYLGFRQGGLEPDTVAVASAAAFPHANGGEPNGFAGPIRLLIALGRDGVLKGLRLLESRETPSYTSGLDDWLRGLAGEDLTQKPLGLDRVDGLSGATVTSRAALETINGAARLASQVAFGTAVPPTLAADRGGGADWGLWATAALLAMLIPVYLSGSERLRLVYMIAALSILGIWLNTPVTELDLVHLSQGQAATLSENPQRWLLLGGIALGSVLFGQIWCGYVCPFGALQELISRLGRRLGLRRYPDRRLDQGLRFLKYPMLAAMLILVWTTGSAVWATFDPMQHVFGARLWSWGWMTLLAALVLAACLFHVRFWCRYLCPMGAFLALGNKLAFAQRLAPRRRLEHCDLGVRGEHDLDCIRCNRCIGGRDTHIRRAFPTAARAMLFHEPRREDLPHQRGRPWHGRERRLLALVALTLLCAGLYLAEELRVAARQGVGYRVIDTQAVQRRIGAGELRDLEALWYHPTRPEEAPGAPRESKP